jgi:phosphoenolpyruvate carboxylase
MLRWNRLKVIDEISQRPSYYRHTFLSELPRFYAALQDRLSEGAPRALISLHSFAIGSWIGGDRTATRSSPRQCCDRLCSYRARPRLATIWRSCHLLGGELSLDARLVGVSEELKQLAARSPDLSVHRKEEPYRRAISGLYARLAATAARLGHAEVATPASDATPYEEPGEFLQDLNTVHGSLQANGSAQLTRGRLRMLRRAVDVFGFHLASIDLRQNADVHERTVAELLDVAGASTYMDLDEAGRVDLLLRELRSARPLVSPHVDYSPETASELAIFREGAALRKMYGELSVPNCVISKANAVSDVLEVALLLKEAGLLRPRGKELDVNIVPLFETIDDLRNCPGIMHDLFAIPDYLDFVRSRGMSQEIMLGYSDSNKDGGFSRRPGNSTKRKSQLIEIFPGCRSDAASLSRPRRIGRARRRTELPGNPRPAWRRRPGAPSASPNRAKS